MIRAIVLAAGSSRRFGSNKLLYPLGGKPLFRYALDAMAEAVRDWGNADLTVVSRYREILDHAADAGFSAVDCPESAGGISYTIRAGVRSLRELAPEDYLVFLAADQPYIRAETIGRLFGLTKENPLSACVSYRGEYGNPVLFSATLAGELCALEGDRGGKAVLRRHPERCLTVEADDPDELKDVDVPEDLEKR